MPSVPGYACNQPGINTRAGLHSAGLISKELPLHTKHAHKLLHTLFLRAFGTILVPTL